MKKFTVSLLFFLCLSFNMIGVTRSVAAPTTANTFSEGVYKLSDFNISTDNLYSVQNVSSTDSVYLLLFDEDRLSIQSIRLEPSSAKYNLLPLKPNYRLVIVGNGNVYIDLKPL